MQLYQYRKLLQLNIIQFVSKNYWLKTEDADSQWIDNQKSYNCTFFDKAFSQLGD